MWLHSFAQESEQTQIQAEPVPGITCCSEIGNSEPSYQRELKLV